jgi:hypothetical protein
MVSCGRREFSKHAAAREALADMSQPRNIPSAGAPAQKAHSTDDSSFKAVLR